MITKNPPCFAVYNNVVFFGKFCRDNIKAALAKRRRRRSSPPNPTPTHSALHIDSGSFVNDKRVSNMGWGGKLKKHAHIHPPRYTHHSRGQSSFNQVSTPGEFAFNYCKRKCVPIYTIIQEFYVKKKHQVRKP